MGPGGILVVSRRCFEAESEHVFPWHSCLKHHMPQTGGEIFPKQTGPNNLNLLITAERSGFTLCFLPAVLGEGWRGKGGDGLEAPRARNMDHRKSSWGHSSAKRLAGPLLASNISLCPSVLLCSIHL